MLSKLLCEHRVNPLAIGCSLPRFSWQISSNVQNLTQKAYRILVKDGNVVVFHDDNLKRMTGVDAIIESFTHKEIKKFMELIETLDFCASFISERHPMPCTLKIEYLPIGTSPC